MDSRKLIVRYQKAEPPSKETGIEEIELILNPGETILGCWREGDYLATAYVWTARSDIRHNRNPIYATDTVPVGRTLYDRGGRGA